MSPALFTQRQAAYDTEKLRFQVKDSKSNWVDVPGSFGFSGPSPTPVTWRVDGPNDDVQRFERGKVDQGDLTLDGRWIPFGIGGRLMDELEESGETTDFRLWFRGGPIFRSGAFAPLFNATITAITAANPTGTLTIGAGTASAAQLAAFNLKNILGSNIGVLLGVDGGSPPAKASSATDLDDVLTMVTEQVLTRLTATVSLPTSAATAPVLAAVPFSLVKLPFYREFSGFVQGRSQTGTQEQPVDSQTTLKVNTKPVDYVDVDNSKAELKRLYGTPLAP